jgi:DNA-binding transcriptional ArsR family regulator
LDPVKILAGEEEVAAAVRALNDESRRQILHALRARPMSTSELCSFLEEQESEKDVKPQTVRYHLKELEKSGLIQQDGYAPAGNGASHVMTKIWRATAETIFIATGSLDDLPERVPAELERSLDLVGTLRPMGFSIPDETTLRELADHFHEQDELWRKGRERAKQILKEIPEIDPGVYIALRRILSVVLLDDSDFEKYCDVSRAMFYSFRKAYLDGKGENPKVY